MFKTDSFSESYRALTPKPSAPDLIGGGQNPVVYDPYGSTNDQFNSITGRFTQFSSLNAVAGNYIPKDLNLKLDHPTVIIKEILVTPQENKTLVVKLEIANKILPIVQQETVSIGQVVVLNLENGGLLGTADIPMANNIDTNLIEIKIPVNNIPMPTSGQSLVSWVGKQTSIGDVQSADRISDYYIAPLYVPSPKSENKISIDSIAKITSIVKLNGKLNTLQITYFNVPEDFIVPIPSSPYKYVLEIRSNLYGQIFDIVNFGLSLFEQNATVQVINPQIIPGKTYFCIIRDWSYYYLTNGKQEPKIISNIVEFVAPELTNSGALIF